MKGEEKITLPKKEKAGARLQNSEIRARNHGISNENTDKRKKQDKKPSSSTK